MSDTSAVEESETTSNDAKQFLTFQLAKERYGVDILHIKEIIEYANLTPVPMMPDFIAGVINLRGSVVPVINLALRFGEEATKVDKHTSIVVIEPSGDGSSTEIGIMVDMVNEVLDISESQIAPPPTFGTSIRTDFISGMGSIEDGFLILLDVAKVLSINELSMLQEMSESTPSISTATETSDDK
jgi:purine-binding chemotaxis protein CheW